MVLTTRPIGPFWRAKTCSTAERTLDLALLERTRFAGIGLPFGFLLWMRETPAIDEVLLIGLER
jgi:hypothetical protein